MRWLGLTNVSPRGAQRRVVKLWSNPTTECVIYSVSPRHTVQYFHSTTTRFKCFKVKPIFYSLIQIQSPRPPTYIVQHPKVDSSFQTKAVYKNLGTTYTDSYSKTSCNLLASFRILRMPPSCSLCTKLTFGHCLIMQME